MKRKNIFYISTKFINFSKNDGNPILSLHKNKIFYDELFNYWSYTNEKKKKQIERTKVMIKELISLEFSQEINKI